jgi:hypothetical protein
MTTIRPASARPLLARASAFALACAALSLAASASAQTPTRTATPASGPGALQFEVTEGRNLNSFTRRGPVAAHLLLRSGHDPRILVAFPAGNSGVGLWFAHRDGEVHWTLAGAPKPVVLSDAKGRPLYGIEADATVQADSLAPKQAVLSSVRVLRDYQALGTAPDSVLVAPVIEGDRISWTRDRLDGAPGYRLSLTVTDGRIEDGRLIAGADGKIGLHITALSGETPLTPLGGEALLNGRANPDPKARNTLAFLSYREKFMAGSWRFNTYFGRDTLMSVRLLMPVLQPAAVDGGLRSVVARISPEGEVAHEEGIGEFAVLEHLKAGEPASDKPFFDYAMIDSSYMLAPVAAAWLLDDPRGRAEAKAFLAGPSGRAGDAGETVGAALMRNLRLILAQAKPFADQPSVGRLLSIKPGHQTGQWRDSETGLGGGRLPYDVNAVFAPAALSAIARMSEAGLLAPYANEADRKAIAEAAHMAAVWRDKAPGYFEVTVPAETARRDVEALAAREGVPAGPALASLPKGPLRFHALSLNADGSPVRVVNSDEGFELMFGRPSPAALSRAVADVMRPFPAGLMTGVGMLVADPAFAGPETQKLFTRNAYHGLVVWSWQQALMAAGLERQLQRTDLPPAVRAELVAARRKLWAGIEANRQVANSELWSWAFADGRYKVVPFGAGDSDADESNAAQLWSTVFLALKPPASH